MSKDSSPFPYLFHSSSRNQGFRKVWDRRNTLSRKGNQVLRTQIGQDRKRMTFFYFMVLKEGQYWNHRVVRFGIHLSLLIIRLSYPWSGVRKLVTRSTRTKYSCKPLTQLQLESPVLLSLSGTLCLSLTSSFHILSCLSVSPLLSRLSPYVQLGLLYFRPECKKCLSLVFLIFTQFGSKSGRYRCQRNFGVSVS